MKVKITKAVKELATKLKSSKKLKGLEFSHYDTGSALLITVNSSKQCIQEVQKFKQFELNIEQVNDDIVRITEVSYRNPVATFDEVEVETVK